MLLVLDGFKFNLIVYKVLDAIKLCCNLVNFALSCFQIFIDLHSLFIKLSLELGIDVLQTLLSLFILDFKL